MHFQLKNHVPYLVARVFALGSEAVAPVLREFDITLPMWRVLAALYDYGEQTAGELLVATSLEQSTLSRTISALSRRGFVSRKASRGNKRTITVGLLARGRTLSEQLLPHMVDAHRTLVAGVDPARLEIFLDVIDQLYENASRATNTPTARMRSRVRKPLPIEA